MSTLLAFLAGAITMGFAICALFFLRFWTRTKDPLFLSFAAAFALFSVGQALLVTNGVPVEERSLLYLVRLIAFLVIIVAIWRKNRRGSRGDGR